MKAIKNFADIKVDLKNADDFVLKEIDDAKLSGARLILNILVDISGTMRDDLPTVNEQLNLFIERIFTRRDDIKYLADICVTAFGRGGIEIVKPFGLIKENPHFDLKDFNGTTPLGSAMLLAYKQCLERKAQYDEFDIRTIYRPVIVIISDFTDNDTLVKHIDGIEYASGQSIYDEMAELFEELQEQKVMTVIPIASPKYDPDEFAKLPGKYSFTPQLGNFEAILSELFLNLYRSMGVRIGERGPVRDYESEFNAVKESGEDGEQIRAKLNNDMISRLSEFLEDVEEAEY